MILIIQKVILLKYIKSQNESNYETEFVNDTTNRSMEMNFEGSYILRTMSPEAAKNTAKTIYDKRISLLSRYPTHDLNYVRYDKGR